MKIKSKKNQSGFTLIETMMAMAIFTIGLLGLFGMQTSAINENLVANSITTGSTWAVYQVEHLLGLSYTAPELAVTSLCSELSPSKWWKNTGTRYEDEEDPLYDLYWAVANDCLLSTISDANTEQQEQKPKYLRIVVVKTDTEDETAQFDYIRQNVQIK
ncbi:MAG: prepilin-type N-terminal cleavage/methylation domain-containing protein [Candidatus Electrothrix sp. AR3]|nr:prepilin-type N-terminal cleavage/methylation domain-containing protein [Candidatus Electrothrix sp. AR3]